MSTKKYTSQHIKNKEIGKALTEQRLSKDKKPSIFCENIKKYRLEKGWTQSDLAKRSGIHQAKISGFENGTFPKDESRIIAIADALNIGLDELFGRKSK